ncbi:MAG: serine/threonine-protein kinase [Sandaracinaceae bacterium]
MSSEVTRTLGGDRISSEHAGYLRRLSKGARVALVIWPTFFLVDVYLVTWVYPEGRLLVFALLRLLGLLVLLGAVIRLTVAPLPSPRLARVLDTISIGAMVVFITLGSMEAGGLTSPLSLGVITVLVGRGALIAESWRSTLFPVALSTAAHPVTLLIMAAVLPDMRAQLSDPQQVALFGLNQLFVGGAAMVALYGGQAVYEVRRQVTDLHSLGRYELLSRIGEGGMGTVWRATDKALVRDVAVKVLHAKASLDEKHVTRFEREARATARLEHPNTVRVFDFGVAEDGTLYYAMELLEGEDLGTVLKRGRLTPTRAVEILVQACHSLAEAHGTGIVHRDIKPANLFLTQVEGLGVFVKVLDFGLAKRAAVDGADGDETLTRLGTVVGTPTYLAPEVCMGQEADARADIYALGTVLYIGLTGRAPFQGDMRSLIQQRMRDDPPRPSEFADVPAELEDVLLRCLARDPDQRFGTTLELAEALLDCDLGTGEPPTTTEMLITSEL